MRGCGGWVWGSGVWGVAGGKGRGVGGGSRRARGAGAEGRVGTDGGVPPGSSEETRGGASGTWVLQDRVVPEQRARRQLQRARATRRVEHLPQRRRRSRREVDGAAARQLHRARRRRCRCGAVERRLRVVERAARAGRGRHGGGREAERHPLVHDARASGLVAAGARREGTRRRRAVEPRRQHAPRVLRLEARFRQPLDTWTARTRTLSGRPGRSRGSQRVDEAGRACAARARGPLACVAEVRVGRRVGSRQQRMTASHAQRAIRRRVTLGRPRESAPVCSSQRGVPLLERLLLARLEALALPAVLEPDLDLTRVNLQLIGQLVAHREGGEGVGREDGL